MQTQTEEGSNPLWTSSFRQKSGIVLSVSACQRGDQPCNIGRWASEKPLLRPVLFVLLLVLLVVGCASGKERPGESGKRSDLPPVQTPQPTPESAARADVGYLRVLVRSGASGQNPPVADAEIRIEETGIELKTDDSGNSPAISLPAPDPHPVIQSGQIGYYTITVTRPGFKRDVYHGFVHGGSTAQNPTTVDVYLTPGEGEHVVIDTPVVGRTAPQTPGPTK